MSSSVESRWPPDPMVFLPRPHHSIPPASAAKPIAQTPTYPQWDKAYTPGSAVDKGNVAPRQPNVAKAGNCEKREANVVGGGRHPARCGPDGAKECDIGAGKAGLAVHAQTAPPGTGKTNWRLLEARVRECLRVAHYAYRTEQTYLGWIRQFVVFHQWQKPSTMEAGHVRDFLRHLVMDRQVASSTQNQALNTVVFLFKSVIKKAIGDFSDFQRARRGLRLPIVASREEIKAVINVMSGRERFMGVLLYGTGMRINELLRLRVQDVQFDQKCLMVRGGKGDKDRYVPFPTKYRDEMKQWLQKRQEQYQVDKDRNMHEVEVPGALAVKYPNAPYEWRWQYVFAADDFSEDPRSGHVRRHHVDEQHLQRAVREAVRAAGLTIRFTPHCFRYVLCFVMFWA